MQAVILYGPNVDVFLILYNASDLDFLKPIHIGENRLFSH
jgi:hypothetical protein